MSTDNDPAPARLVLDHVGICVPALEPAADIWRGAFGLDVDWVEPLGRVDAAAIGLPGSLVALRGMMLRGTGHCGIELHEYHVEDPVKASHTAETQRPTQRRVCDAGANHVAFRSRQIAEDAAFLTREWGMRWNSPPLTIATGPLTGRSWCYGSLSGVADGLTIELCQYDD